MSDRAPESVDPVTPDSAPAASARDPVGPASVRVTLGQSSAHGGQAPLVIEPGPPVLVDGEVAAASMTMLDPGHGLLSLGSVGATDRPRRHRLLLEPAEGSSGGRGAVLGLTRREVVVDGWRVELEIESERLARLRERARRGRDDVGRSGPTEVRAIIPGRILSVSVAAGDAVTAGQQLLVVEAMKMQNELRAPRDGIVSRTVVGPGENVELGDVMLVIE